MDMENYYDEDDLFLYGDTYIEPNQNNKKDEETPTNSNIGQLSTELKEKLNEPDLDSNSEESDLELELSRSVFELDLKQGLEQLLIKENTEQAQAFKSHAIKPQTTTKTQKDTLEPNNKENTSKITFTSNKTRKELDVDPEPFLDDDLIFDKDLNDFVDKPWKKPGADLTDYFNFGFNENTWKKYCDKQKVLREGGGSKNGHRSKLSRYENDFRHHSDRRSTTPRDRSLSSIAKARDRKSKKSPVKSFETKSKEKEPRRDRKNDERDKKDRSRERRSKESTKDDNKDSKRRKSDSKDKENLKSKEKDRKSERSPVKNTESIRKEKRERTDRERDKKDRKGEEKDKKESRQDDRTRKDSRKEEKDRKKDAPRERKSSRSSRTSTNEDSKDLKRHKPESKPDDKERPKSINKRKD